MFPEPLMKLLGEKLAGHIDDYLLPPPVFMEMQGEFVSFDADKRILVNRFPVQEKYQNPYRSMQGGIVAAAMDNTIGPLSMLVAPPNVTRRMEIKYIRPVGMEHKFIIVTGKLAKQEDRQLKFIADARTGSGELLARAHASHWIVEGL